MVFNGKGETERKKEWEKKTIYFKMSLYENFTQYLFYSK